MNDQLKKISPKELFDRCVTTPGYGDNVLTIDWSDKPQGKEFYEALKYEMVGSYENKVDGYTEYFFVKRFD